MNLKKVHHIAIIGSNYEQSKHFYVDLLGFSIIRENYRPERDDYKIDLQLDGIELELFIMKLSPQCMPEKSKIFLADGHSPYHSRYIQTSPCKHVRSVYSRLALLIAYAHYIIFPPQNI